MGKKPLAENIFTPSAGVRNDFNRLLENFTSKETVRYEHFAEIWREMKMSYIFSGRQNTREAREFVEDCLKIASQFYLSPYNFQIRVGALYLLYGLFSTQPLVTKCKIRVLPEQWQDILEFQKEVQLQEHLDVAYVFHKLRVNRAFEFAACATEVYRHMNSRSIDDIIINEEFQEEQSVLFDLFSTESLEQVAAVHQHYHKVKVALKGSDATRPSQSLNIINGDLVPNITKAIMNYQEKRKTVNNPLKKKGTATESEVDDEEEDDYSSFLKDTTSEGKRSRLKKKAYKNLAKAKRSRRHRQVQDEVEEKSLTKRKRGAQKKKKIEESDEEEERESLMDHPGEITDVKMEENDEAKTTLLSMPDLEPEITEKDKPQNRKRKQPAKSHLDEKESNSGVKTTNRKAKTGSKRKKPVCDADLGAGKSVVKSTKKKAGSKS